MALPLGASVAKLMMTLSQKRSTEKSSNRGTTRKKIMEKETEEFKKIKPYLYSSAPDQKLKAAIIDMMLMQYHAWTG